MQQKLIHFAERRRTYALVLDTGDEAMDEISKFAVRERITAAQISGIGAFSAVVLRYFDWDRKEYQDLPVDEQVEVASLLGDIGEDAEKGGPAVHVHLVVGRRDGSALAGHLKTGQVRPTLELIVAEAPSHLCRRKDPASGVNLLKL